MKQRTITIILLAAFLLGSHRGYIALWKDGAADPVEVFPNKVSSLPPADQQALMDGIRIEEETTLIYLLEDFLS